jgi:hypothetical protein
MNQEFAQLVKYPEMHHVLVGQVKSLSVVTEEQLKFK